jgi:hypothetical protein
MIAGPLALLSFCGFLWWTLGDPLAWSKAQHQWGRSFSPTGVFAAIWEVVTAPFNHEDWLFRDAAFCVAYILLLRAASVAGVPRAWILAGALIVLLPLASGTVTSDARFGLLALPVFWGFAVVGRRRSLDRLVRLASPVLLAVAVFTIPLRYP